MTDEPCRPKPINLDELIAKRLPEDITYTEYRDAAKDPQHPLHDSNNPRHESYVQAEETLKKSAQATSDAIKKMLGDPFKAARERMLESTKFPAPLAPNNIEDDLRKRWETSLPVVPSIEVRDIPPSHMELLRKDFAAAQVEREERDAQRHQQLQDNLLTLSAHMVDQRDELAKMRVGQEAGEKWQKTATKWGLAIGAFTLLATLVSIGVAVFLAV